VLVAGIVSVITGGIRKQNGTRPGGAGPSRRAQAFPSGGKLAVAPARENGASAAETGSIQPHERRQYSRLKCEGTAEFRKDGIETSVTGQLTDISGGGCYVEMQATSPPGTFVSLVLTVHEFCVHVQGKVQVCYPLLGMGIAFTRISPQDHAELGKLLQHLASRQSSASSPVPAAPDPPHSSSLLMVTDAAAALAAVADFFANHNTLEQGQFEELIRQSQERTRHR
jgi:PilZ domain